MKRTGRCLCGQITFETEAADLWAGHCHCDSCRRANAAPMTSFFGVPRDSLTLRGKVSEYASSPGVQRGYCADCGSQIYYHADIWPDETHLFAANLDDPRQFHPQAHYHYAEKLPWLNITDDLPKHAGSADD